MKATTLTKHELAERIYEKSMITRSEIQRIIDIMVEQLIFGLQKDKVLLLSGFGAWEVQEKKARMGRDPQKKTRLLLPARKNVSFRLSKKLRQDLN